MGKRVLALDLATSAGWAWGEVGSKPRFGTISLGSTDRRRGMASATLIVWLTDFFKIERPDLIVYEAPLNIAVMRKIGANAHTAQRAFGLCEVVDAVCALKGLPEPRQAKVQDVRGAFLGRRTFSDEINPVTGRKVKSRAIAKSETMRMCRVLGFDVKTDDEADAIAVWHYGCSLLDPRQAMLMGDG